MTDDDVRDLLSQMEKIFGDKLPNPEHFPQSFLYYYKLYKYFHLNEKTQE